MELEDIAKQDDGLEKLKVIRDIMKMKGKKSKKQSTKEEPEEKTATQREKYIKCHGSGYFIPPDYCRNEFLEFLESMDHILHPDEVGPIMDRYDKVIALRKVAKEQGVDECDSSLRVSMN